ncbi:hypothetical protein [Streptomyces sp. 7N604]|uniref:hypothetical protein n=1 Tax=Streptomyces sp. 7N604 TaxID=3457415 RepID=UPI003FD35B49
MTFPPSPNEPTPPAAGGGFGPPQGYGPGPGYGSGQGPGQGHGYGPPPGPAYGRQGGFPAPQGGYGAYPPPPPPSGGGPSGPKIAAIFIAGVLVAGLTVGGLLLFKGSDDGDASADAKPRATPGGQPDDRPSAGPGEGAPSAPASASASPGDLVPFVVLKPGQCFDHPALDRSVAHIVTRSCGAAHDGEVIANKRLTGSYSSDAQLQEKALALCETAVAERMKSIPEDGRQYFNYALYPSLDTYRIRQEKRISCALTLSNRLGGKKLTKPLPG